jgi:hypothetical protein
MNAHTPSELAELHRSIDRSPSASAAEAGQRRAPAADGDRTPPAGSDILAEIAADREDLERQLRVIQGGLDPRPSLQRPVLEIAEQIEDLVIELRLHAAVKQEVFYAASLRDAVLREHTRKLVVQQESIDFLLMKLLVTDFTERSETRALLAVLSDQLRHHARTEQESALCSGVTGTLCMDTRAAMGQKFTERKKSLRAHIEKEIALFVA